MNESSLKKTLARDDVSQLQKSSGLDLTPDVSGEFSPESVVDHAGAEDVSRIVGTVVAKVGGKSYTVGPFSFKHWGTTQSLLLDEKRGRIISAVRSAKKIDRDLSDGEYRLMMREAMSQAGNTSSLGPEDASYIIATPEGLGTCLWVMIEDTYRQDPHRPDRATCQKEVYDALNAQDATLLGDQVLACMGITDPDSAGNGNGQSQTA